MISQTDQFNQDSEQKLKDKVSLEQTVAQLHNNNIRLQQEKEQLVEQIKIMELGNKDKNQTIESLKLDVSVVVNFLEGLPINQIRNNSKLIKKLLVHKLRILPCKRICSHPNYRN